MKVQMKIKPLFLLGSIASFFSEDGIGFCEITDKAEQEKKTEEILKKLAVEMEPALLVRTDEDLHNLDINADAFIVFGLTTTRFPHLILLARAGKPIILTGEEGALGNILDTLEYISEFKNVECALTYEEVRRKIRILRAANLIQRMRICIFDRGEHPLTMVPWLRNHQKKSLRVQYVDIDKFENIYRKIEKTEAEKLARKWFEESEIVEPSLEDVTKSASVYLAMKETIEEMDGDAAYVLWCGQFTPILGTKMCFAIAKLNDDNYVTGCWRGGNLQPMLILYALSCKPVFFGEIHAYSDCVLSVRHCAVSRKIHDCSYILKKWRDQEGTVTGYCELPKGEVTVLCQGLDSLVVLRGKVIDCRDIGGTNCRTTVWIALEDEEAVHCIAGREIAFCYGDFMDDIKEVGRLLGIEVKYHLIT